MRDLTPSDRNEITINDTRSGTEIKLFYRNPKTQEEVGYQAALFVRKGGKLKINAFETRLKYGLQILTGIREGDFGINGQPISSDLGSKNYREDWKALIKDQAPDIVTAFAFAIFEGARIGEGPEIGYEGLEEEGKEAPAGEDEDAPDPR